MMPLPETVPELRAYAILEPEDKQMVDRYMNGLDSDGLEIKTFQHAQLNYAYLKGLIIEKYPEEAADINWQVLMPLNAKIMRNLSQQEG